jgi:hypothetical protein
MSYSMRPLGFCDCNAPFYLIKGLIYYSCDRCKAGSPVGNCTICYGAVYLINSKLQRTCDCGSANVGNITYKVTAVLDPQALTSQITTGSSTEPLYLPSYSEMSQTEEDHSHVSQSETDAVLPPSPDHIRKIYKAISLAMTYHASHCTDCDMLSEQSLMCPQWIQMSDSRRFWSKRLPDEDRCSA